MTHYDRIRARFALALGRKPPEGECPAPQEIQAWHERRLASADTRRLKAHVAHCDHCFALWSGLVELDAQAVTEGQAHASLWQSLAGKLGFGRRPDGASRRLAWGLALPALAVAAVALTILLGGPDLAPLPSYEFSLQGELDYRGGDVQEPMLIVRDGAFVELVFMPATAVPEAMDLRAYARTGDRLQPLAVPVEITDKGVAVVAGELGSDIVLPANTTRLYVVLGRQGALPRAARLQSLLSGRPSVRTDDWGAWALTVERPQD